MNKYLRFLLPSIAVLFLFNATAVDTQAQILREILNRMDTNNRSLKSLKASVKMNKLDSVLGENDLYEGSLSYIPGRSQNQIFVRIDWAKPRVEHLAVANGSYVIYRPGSKWAATGKVDSVKGGGKAGGVLAFMSMSKAQLAANYSVEYAGEETVKNGTKAWHLVLTPKQATSYKSAELWVDSNGMPVQAKIIEKNNDTTTLLLSDIQRNATVSASVFKLKPPAGTEIVRG